MGKKEKDRDENPELDLDLDSPLMKALMKYNEDEIDDFMEGSRVNDEPKFSKDFENRLKKALEELEDELK